MRILIFGAGGRTGQVLCRLATQAGHELITPTHADCDLADAARVSATVLGSGAEAVVNAAAISGLEQCLDDPLQAHLVNAVAPAAMALACRHTGALFVHLSTDYVVDGRRPGMKPEGVKCRPVSVYGESKREGELQVAEAYAESLVLRVSWIMGNPLKPSFVEQTLAKAMRGEALAAIADKWSMPTDAEDIARAILELIPQPVSGVVNVCSGGQPQSWHRCALLALQTAVESGALPLCPPVLEQTLEQARFFREQRPRHTAMDNTKLRSLGIAMPTAEQTVQRVALRYLDFCRQQRQG